jgi:hypothetical protein
MIDFIELSARSGNIKARTLDVDEGLQIQDTLNSAEEAVGFYHRQWSSSDQSYQ